MAELPDPPTHRLRTLTVLATAAVAVASVALDEYKGPAAKAHVFSGLGAAVRGAWRDLVG